MIRRQLPILPPMPFIPENMPPWAEEHAMFRRNLFEVRDYNSPRSFWESPLMRASILRDYYKDVHAMFTFVCWDWVRPLAEWIGDRRCLEIGAGIGYLAYALRECGVNLIATDDYSWHEERGWPTVTDIERLDAVEAVQKYGEQIDFLIICWANMDDTSYRAAQELCKVNPKALIIHIGEGSGGCTDSSKFFLTTEYVEDTRFQEIKRKYNAWVTLHDRLNLLRPTC